MRQLRVSVVPSLIDTGQANIQSQCVGSNGGDGAPCSINGKGAVICPVKK